MKMTIFLYILWFLEQKLNCIMCFSMPQIIIHTNLCSINVYWTNDSTNRLSWLWYWNYMILNYMISLIIWYNWLYDIENDRLINKCLIWNWNPWIWILSYHYLVMKVGETTKTLWFSDFNLTNGVTNAKSQECCENQNETIHAK